MYVIRVAFRVDHIVVVVIVIIIIIIRAVELMC